MKLLSYCRMGETSFGIGKKDGVIDLGLRLKNKLPDKTISNFLSIFDFKYLERFVNLSVDYFILILLSSQLFQILIKYFVLV